ncbi:hypothetical protein, partial [Pseudoduganella albidiflava]|uniref:hypothetical protein n=1 Tax=Pseudoduganella albidiflava TaxID=321983 RepID=UPI001E5DF8C5
HTYRLLIVKEFCPSISTSGLLRISLNFRSTRRQIVVFVSSREARLSGVSCDSSSFFFFRFAFTCVTALRQGQNYSKRRLALQGLFV